MAHRSVLYALSLLVACATQAVDNPKPKNLTLAELLSGAKAADWRPLDPQNTVYLELAAGRVVIELMPAFAPAHVANIKALVQERYYDGLAIVRAQDNYVVQWGDPASDTPSARKIEKGKRNLPGEFDRMLDTTLPFARLTDGDIYAPEVGFCNGFPVARDPKSNRMWLLHCYGMVGVGRDLAADSGGGTELYVVIGQSPRQLDRNVTLVGRVWQGMELLSSLPRGTGPLGFYERPEQRVPIKAIVLAADVPPGQRTNLEIFRTDTPLFQELIEARRNRHEEWFHYQAGHIDVCNVPIPVRTAN